MTGKKKEEREEYRDTNQDELKEWESEQRISKKKTSVKSASAKKGGKKSDAGKTKKKSKSASKRISFAAMENRMALVNDFIHDEKYSPMKEKDLAVFLQVEKEDRNELAQILETLVNDGQIQRTGRGRFVKSDGGLVGVFTSNAKGFGFVTIEGREEDIYIPAEETGGAFLGDTVAVELLSQQAGKRVEGRITRIVLRALTEVVGTYESSKTYGFVKPDNYKIPTDIFVLRERSKGAVDGDKVVVEISDYGNAATGKNPEGKVKEIIGNINDPGVDILSIVKGYDLPNEFPERVMNQTARTPEEVSDADMDGRMDLRDMQMVTIDGEESKDLDDAVSLTVDEKGLYHLGVHIADVANYVQEGSALDREALKRGTSVYLVDRVIPMLPHKLSNGICSLNHGEDRLAMSCLMTVNRNGEIIDHKIAETVINVDERMTYTSVAKIILDHDEEEMARYEALVPMFEQMYELAKILKKHRHERGSIDFDTPEAKITLDREGNPLEIKPEVRNAANELIEDFMLAANETVAQHFFWMQVPFLYRTHEQPSEEKMNALVDFVRGFGYHLNIRQDEIHPMELQKLLDKVEGSPEESVISKITLRSMMQAKYTTECVGHFGLALKYYSHFTSPIRRYPDLQIHRIIKDVLRGRLSEAKIQHYTDILPEVAKHCSETERRADDAERDTDKLKKAQFMEQHIGEVFEGIISGVTGWGMFVELDNTCEGLVRLADMDDDYYIFDQENYLLYGESSGREFRLGQKVRIKVVGADRLEKTVDFRILNDGDDPDKIKLNYVRKPLYVRNMEERQQEAEMNKERADEPSFEKKGRGTKRRKEDRSGRQEEVRTVRGKKQAQEPQEEYALSDRFDFSDGESEADDNLMTPAELREHERKKRLLREYVPDGRTGKPQPKNRKQYKEHKFKKSATSKGARSNQRKGKH